MKSSGVKCESYRLGCLLLITLNKSSSLEGAGGRIFMQEDQHLPVTLQGCGVEEEGGWEGWILIKQAQRGAGWVLGGRVY